MEKDPIRLLIVESSSANARRVRNLLPGNPSPTLSWDVHEAGRLDAALATLRSINFDIIFLNPVLPDRPILTAVTDIRTATPDTPLIILMPDNSSADITSIIQANVQNLLFYHELDESRLHRTILLAIEWKKARAHQRNIAAELNEKANELEKRNIALDEFASTLAHQIQGLLSQMIGYASYLEMHYAADTNADVQQSLTSIVESGHKMDNIITELLLLASIRSGHLQIYPLEMGRIVNEVQKRLRYRIKEQQAEIILPNSWPAALGHAPWIEEVWLNYISNGLKYGGEQPHLELGAELISGNMIRFWVKDEGIGISAADQPRLFKPHTRLRPRRFKGEGLGLSIVKRIVVKCGGEVGVISEVGKGSTFWFTLPAA